MISSLVAGSNADLMRAVAELYLEPDDVIVDATYGRGLFWRRLPELDVIQHDLYVGDGVDMRALPEADRSVDALVLDPPYRLTESTPSAHRKGPDFEERYGLGRDTELTNTAAGIVALDELYRDGLLEAERVLSDRGRVFVKAQDFIDSHRLVPMGFRTAERIEDAGLELIDLFILSPGPGPRGPWTRQLRARRAHSYLFVAGRSRYWTKAEPRKVELVRGDALF